MLFRSRRKGCALAPTIDNRAKLFERMLDIGAYNFGAQYQQKPFEHTNDQEARGGCFAEPDDEYGFPQFSFGVVSEVKIMAYELFGVGTHHPAMPRREMTREEFERYAVWTEDYQRRLREDRNAKWGRPENEEALLAAYKTPRGEYGGD